MLWCSRRQTWQTAPWGRHRETKRWPLAARCSKDTRITWRSRWLWTRRTMAGCPSRGSRAMTKSSSWVAWWDRALVRISFLQIRPIYRLSNKWRACETASSLSTRRRRQDPALKRGKVSTCTRPRCQMSKRRRSPKQPRTRASMRVLSRGLLSLCMGRLARKSPTRVLVWPRTKASWTFLTVRWRASLRKWRSLHSVWTTTWTPPSWAQLIARTTSRKSLRLMVGWSGRAREPIRLKDLIRTRMCSKLLFQTIRFKPPELLELLQRLASSQLLKA